MYRPLRSVHDKCVVTANGLAPFAFAAEIFVYLSPNEKGTSRCTRAFTPVVCWTSRNSNGPVSFGKSKRAYQTSEISLTLRFQEVARLPIGADCGAGDGLPGTYRQKDCNFRIADNPPITPSFTSHNRVCGPRRAHVRDADVQRQLRIAAISRCKVPSWVVLCAPCPASRAVTLIVGPFFLPASQRLSVPPRKHLVLKH